MSKSDFKNNMTDKVLDKIIGEFTINSILDKKITDLTEIEAKFFTQKNIGIITNRGKIPKRFQLDKSKTIGEFYRELDEEYRKQEEKVTLSDLEENSKKVSAQERQDEPGKISNIIQSDKEINEKSEETR